MKEQISIHTGGSVKDPTKLLQDMDVNRLRAVVYRDVVLYSAIQYKHNESIRFSF